MLKQTGITKSLSQSDTERKWHMVNVKDQVLGRITPQIVKYLQGKQKIVYTPNLDCGDYVVVVNASEVRVTGQKLKAKVYTKYSGYPGGKTDVTLQNMLKVKPEEVIKHAVSGMLPKNKLRNRRMARLFVFKGEEHPYKDKIK